MNPSSGNFDQFVRDTVAQEIAKAGAAGGAAQPEPLELNVGGQKFTYANRAELEASLNNFVGAAGQKFAELQGMVDQAQTPQAQGSYVTGDDPTPKWDDQQFVQKMTESPQEGLKYAFNQLFFDGKSADPIQDMKESLVTTEQTKRNIAAYQFKENHREFPGGQQFAQKIDEIRTSMNLPYDYNGLEAAYLIGIQRGALPNFYQAQAQADLQAQAVQAGQIPQGPMDPRQFNGGFGMNGNLLQNNPYTAAPPGINRGSQFQGAQPDYDSLSTEQIEAIFSKAGRPIYGGS